MQNKQIFTNTAAIVLAAGKGTRLGCTDKPKVMLEIGGRPIVDYSVSTLEKVGFTPEQICLVVNFYKEKVIEHFGARVQYATQTELLGTAHAAFTGIKTLPEQIEQVLVMGGDDSAFYTPETLQNFITEHQKSGAVLTCLTAEPEKVDQLGRIVRHDGWFEIIEKEYLTEEQKNIHEISTGTFMFDRWWFESIFPTMSPLKKLGEYGLPTTLSVAREQGKLCRIEKLVDSSEWFGVNTPEELQEADRRKRQVAQ